MSESTWETAPLVAIQSGKEERQRDSFKTFSERLKGEREQRIALGKRRLSFGVSFLDRALGGIFPNDVVLLGAKTGKGKTQLASIIAQTNAMQGKRVHYFALEAEDREIERRAKFSVLYEVMRQTCREMRGGFERLDRMSYLDWYAGDLEDITGPLEETADHLLDKRFSSMSTFYRTTDFYASHFEEMVRAVEHETDLVVLDHLHYVDTEDENENRGYKQIVKRIRDTAITFSKPIVVVAHLRKSERRGAPLVPNEEDFHGTSDVPKIATKAVILAEDKATDTGDPCLWSTFVAPVKCRIEGARARYVGRVNFDIRSGRYVDEFEIGNIVGDKFEITDVRKLPSVGSGGPVTSGMKNGVHARPASDEARKATPTERAELDRVTEAYREAVRKLNEDAEREAKAAGKPGKGVVIARGYVVHPDDRGARKRRRRKR